MRPRPPACSRPAPSVPAPIGRAPDWWPPAPRGDIGGGLTGGGLGGPSRTRTDDILGVNEALYQLSYGPGVRLPIAASGHLVRVA